MTVPAFDGDLIAVNQSMRRVGEVRIAEPPGDGNGGARIDSLNRIHYRHVREPGDVANGTELTAAKSASPWQTTGIQAACRQAKAGDATV